MRSPAGGFVATVLMFVPLIAVPALAVFGIPHFAPVVASSTDDTSDFELKIEPEVRQEGVGESARYTPEDLFTPVSSRQRDRSSGVSSNAEPARIQRPYGFPQQVASAENARPESSRPAEPWPDAPASPASGRDWRDDAPAWYSDEAPQEPPRRSAGASASNSGGNQRISSSGGEAPVRPLFQELEATEFAAAAEPSTGRGEDAFAPDEELREAMVREEAPQITWRDAVRKLNSLGIRHYQLEPGAEEGEFHFSCFYTPDDNPRITHRFEAEAGDPLLAVEKVILQIEQWVVAGR